ncbi:Two-component sensor histidine kinase, contains HisKA and HATPase domains [Faunimonas pinastri]|uniref:Blue-light-activated histidine kinase n=1 Tax=Faunimonas pinastri TaxID=1855383 RepID=A0A1H9MDR6_9HYPH|nr:HWE histidine kinase domain-containing protein [Faunimonas pinastri]SER21599.1 Two-component sensor histidine kinase, contains HisKA and HATPase domains [Faunimonas pinastri]
MNDLQPDFQALFDASPNAYVLLDPDFHIVDANEAYLTTVERPLPELAGQSIFEAFPSSGASLEMLKASLERVRTTRARDTLALIKYDIPVSGPDGEAWEERFWSATHTPLLDERGEVVFILQHTVDVTDLQRLRQAADDAGISLAPEQIEEGVLERARHVQETNKTLDGERRRLMHLFQQAPGFMCVLRGPDHVYELLNNAYLEAVGHRDLLGKTVRKALPEVASQGIIDLLDRVYRTGEAFLADALPLELARTAGMPPELRYLDFVYQPIVEDDGSISGIFVQGHDVTERKRTEQQRELLVAELNHRVKNTLAIVQSVAVQTVRTAPAPETFRRAFQARIIALSNTHDTLTRGHWESADFRELLEQELKPYGSDRVRLTGPRVRLPPNSTFTVGMAIHELAVNASKYGALSLADGMVTVEWQPRLGLKGESWVDVTWRERGGPPVAEPARKGFGSRLIESGIAGQLGGKASIAFDPEGITCVFAVPLTVATPERTDSSAA